MNLGVIIKLSKLCNLRCDYCYETPELANKQTISLEQMEKMFLHLSTFWHRWANPSGTHKLRFIWHGGEPFAHSVDYWTSIVALQNKIFGKTFMDRYAINSVQSNGTLLTEKHLSIIRNFDVGISYDVFNQHRVDTAGRCTDTVVRRKIDWLREQKIRVAGIAVISKSNIDQPQAIADFFLKRGVSFRALPIYKALDLLPQIRDLALPFEQYLQFYQELFLLPLVRQSMAERLAVEPLTSAFAILNLWKSGKARMISDQHCKELEWVIAVNTDGKVYSPGDCYFPEYAYGNLFTQSMEDLLFESEGRRKRISKSTERINEICHPCFLYRRGCNGTHVSHATPEEFREFSRNRGCYYKLLAETILHHENKVSVGNQQAASVDEKQLESLSVDALETPPSYDKVTTFQTMN